MNYLRGNQLGRPVCLAAEGGTSGKNTSTDQRQVQATSQAGHVVGSDGSINSGTVITTGFGSGGDVNITDQGAVARAFEFGENVITAVGEVLLGESALRAATVTANTDFLRSQTQLLANNTEGGQESQKTNTILYIVLGVLALIGAIFYFKS